MPIQSTFQNIIKKWYTAFKKYSMTSKLECLAPSKTFKIAQLKSKIDVFRKISIKWLVLPDMSLCNTL